MARNLASSGAKYLAFASRSGGTTPDQKKLVADLRSQEGLDARVFQCDIADEPALWFTISQITAGMSKVTGMIFGAMALHDRILPT
ncbi:hypothetical protein H2200_004535 [Cladophialophora chaetospira]|uniref:Ketoreductase (KR) domain-containing protein n=1 Tax=Cladophialophora chaetospira TaxID=386627 RepID=A0AA38XDA3_9EURO|nr:hypothetical protein H2200_004535 [Cladophialophora chaetospira]